MKKAKAAFVTYKDNKIYNMIILNCKGEFIRLVDYDPIDIVHPFKDRTYKSMLDSIVNICKNNGYLLEYKIMFNAKFYNIALTCLDDKNGIIEHTLAWQQYTLP